MLIVRMTKIKVR